MKRHFILLSAFLIFTVGLTAQIFEPVKWDFYKEQVSETEYDLYFKATIEPKWHLYSQDIPMAPPATTFTFEENDGYELVGPVE